MKKKNRILNTFLVVSLLFGALSCKDEFLEIIPKNELSAEAVFVTEAGADLFLNDIYKSLPDPEAMDGPRWTGFHSTYENLNMYSHYYACKFTWSISHRASEQRAYTASNYYDGLYNHGYPANPFFYEFVTIFIRNANFFIESVEQQESLSDDWRKKRLAEVRVLRAYYYHELWKAYGGVPIITEVLSAVTMGDDIFKPSASIQELYDFMVKELGEVANDLPDEIGNGHVTKGAALALKAYIELFMGGLAAEPKPAEIGNLGEANTYYEACAKTCKQIMDLGTYSLFPNYNDQFLAANNFNEESIWVIPHSSTAPSVRTAKHGPKASWYVGGETGSYVPTQELVNMYRMSNGLSIDDPASGYDPLNPYENREKRFYQSIIYDGSKYRGALFTLEGYGEDEALIIPGADVTSGYWRRKGLDESLTGNDLYSSEVCNSPVFRYAEILLMYAEAKFRLGQVDQMAIDALDAVRKRGNLPSIIETYGSIPSTDELLDIIWHERAVELSWEAYKHYWDLIRTRKAEIYLNKPCTGVVRDIETGGYKTRVLVNNKWPSDHNYLFPIYTPWLEKNPVWSDPANQVNGRTAGQNPGY